MERSFGRDPSIEIKSLARQSNPTLGKPHPSIFTPFTLAGGGGRCANVATPRSSGLAAWPLHVDSIMGPTTATTRGESRFPHLLLLLSTQPHTFLSCWYPTLELTPVTRKNCKIYRKIEHHNNFDPSIMTDIILRACGTHGNSAWGAFVEQDFRSV